MRKLLLAGAATLTMLSCTASDTNAQCTQCLVEQNCPLRTTGPMEKEDIASASTLLNKLSQAQATLTQLRDIPDETVLTLAWESEHASILCPYGYSGINWSCKLFIGSMSSMREILIKVTKSAIADVACKLRALGVDVPRP